MDELNWNPPEDPERKPEGELSEEQADEVTGGKQVDSSTPQLYH
ncbi:MAG: hypothetical protein ABSC08_00085 [Bryobacteraceae bacterium]|jgi:hypothetical protein